MGAQVPRSSREAVRRSHPALVRFRETDADSAELFTGNREVGVGAARVAETGTPHRAE
jgi:hypothetical protein